VEKTGKLIFLYNTKKTKSLDNNKIYKYILIEEAIMNKKIIYKLVCCFGVISLVWSSNPMETHKTINWYGQGSLLGNQEFSENNDDNDDDIQRKRRHRRRRKIRPPRKGW